MDDGDGEHIMRTLIRLNESTGVRIIEDVANSEPFSSYDFVISETLLPIVLGFLSNALEKTVTRQTLAADLSVFMAASGFNMTFTEGDALAVSKPDRELTRYMLSVGSAKAVLYTIQGGQNTVSISKAASCQFSVDDWDNFVVGMLGGGDESAAIAAIAAVIGVPVVDERNE